MAFIYRLAHSIMEQRHLVGIKQRAERQAPVDSSSAEEECVASIAAPGLMGRAMKKRQLNDQVVPYPKLRRVLEIMYPAVKRKPMIHGLLEVDVSRARAHLRDHQAKTGESLSFTAFIITCLARAVDESKSLHACRKGSKHLVLFDEVDVATAIEREVAGQKQPIIYIIRAANKKTFPEIHHEIRAAQVEEVGKAWEGFTAAGWLQFLPMVLIRIGWWAFCWMRRRYPQVQKKYGGTVGVTAVGMFGKGGGWGIPVNDHSLDVTLGGIASKPGVIDGAPAARFTQRLKDLIERGYGLCQSEAGNVGSLPG
jgi:pyruvate/2-oxoglutarate dehydrogenase complex dihydrolipoamide acyltransferase (E2) component